MSASRTSGRVAEHPLDADLLDRWPLPIDDHGDKFARGTVLVIGGSATTPGSVLLAGIAALRMGAGRLQIASDAAVTGHLAVAVPEALVLPIGAADDVRELIGTAQCVLVGPGLPSDPATDSIVAMVLQRVSPDSVVVVDAAALGALSSVEPGLLRGVAERLVVTPNRQEAEDLVASLRLDPRGGDLTLEASAERIASALSAVVTSFGLVCAPDGRRWRAADGGPGLGTSGSGDVLAGLVAGAAARTGDAAQAACWATFTHNATGRHLADLNGGVGFLARELVDAIGPAMAGELGTADDRPVRAADRRRSSVASQGGEDSQR